LLNLKRKRISDSLLHIKNQRQSDSLLNLNKKRVSDSLFLVKKQRYADSLAMYKQQRERDSILTAKKQQLKDSLLIVKKKTEDSLEVLKQKSIRENLIKLRKKQFEDSLVKINTQRIEDSIVQVKQQLKLDSLTKERLRQANLFKAKTDSLLKLNAHLDSLRKINEQRISDSISKVKELILDETKKQTLFTEITYNADSVKNVLSTKQLSDLNKRADDVLESSDVEGKFKALVNSQLSLEKRRLIADKLVELFESPASNVISLTPNGLIENQTMSIRRFVDEKYISRNYLLGIKNIERGDSGKIKTVTLIVNYAAPID